MHILPNPPTPQRKNRPRKRLFLTAAVLFLAFLALAIVVGWSDAGGWG